MIGHVQKVRIGAFVAAGAALAALVLIAFGGARLLHRHRSHYYVVLDGSVYGIESGADVYFQGVHAGSVTELHVVPEDLSKVRIEIDVDADTPVKVDTKAVTTFAGITGTKVIDLRYGTTAAARLPAGSTIPAGETELDKVERDAVALAGESRKLIEHADSVVQNIAKLTDPERFGALGANLEKASATLDAMVEENRIALRRSIGSIDRAARATTDLLDGPIHDFVGQLDAIARDGGGQLRSALHDLRQASHTLKDLVHDVREQPSRLLFSKTQPDRKLP